MRANESPVIKKTADVGWKGYSCRQKVELLTGLANLSRYATLRAYFTLPFQTIQSIGDSMTSYAEYVEQIEKLQSLAEAARKDEIAGAVQQIKSLMQQHGISIDDLSSGSRAKPAKAKVSVAAQFKNPETGEMWTGRGRAPRWLDGKERDAYRIAG